MDYSHVICKQILLLFSHCHVWLFATYGPQHSSLPYPSLSPRVCSNSSSFSLWCYLAISSSVAPFSFCLQSCPASGSFSMNQLFASDGWSFGGSSSASVVPINIQVDFLWDWLAWSFYSTFYYVFHCLTHWFTSGVMMNSNGERRSCSVQRWEQQRCSFLLQCSLFPFLLTLLICLSTFSTCPNRVLNILITVISNSLLDNSKICVLSVLLMPDLSLDCEFSWL